MIFVQTAIAGLAKDKALAVEQTHRRVLRQGLVDFIMQRNMTQSELAKAMFVCDATVSNWIYKQGEPKLEIIERFASTFGLNFFDARGLFKIDSG